MEPNPASEDLPALYRAVLDRVAGIAASGRRSLANDVRAEAIRIYSRAWDDRARRELLALLNRYPGDDLEARPAHRGPRSRPISAT
ncbi:MAG: hypothetical protein ACJ77U_06200 [Chloroflexota bacterium]